MLNYSLVKRKSNPMDETSQELIYAASQMIGMIDVEELAAHISTHNSKYNRSDVKGVIETVIDCMIEQLLNGYSIQLGEFGTFALSLKSKGITPEELAENGYNAEYITKVRASWRRGSAFKALREKVSLHMVATRAKQDYGVQAMIEDLTGVSTADRDTEPGEQTGDSGDGNKDS